MNNITEAIAALSTLAEKNSFEVFIPSLKRSVRFKPLTTKQQKSFYNCLSDNVVYNTNLIIATYNIIKDNCLEPDIVQDLTTIDRLSILLALRKNTIGPELNIVKDGVVYNTNFDGCLETVLTIELPENTTVTHRNVKIELQVPRMTDQYGLEKEIREGKEVESATLSFIVENAILNEVCKIIKNVWVIDGENTTDLNYSSFSYKDRLALIENLPAETLLEVQKYIETLSKLTNKILTVPLGDSSTVFSITVDFFLDV
jgi:hypothetical protein